MLITIGNVLGLDEVRQCRARLDAATWHDGNLTAGSLARQVKRNEQLAADDPLAVELGNLILRRLGQTPTFIAAALPHRIHPPRFNCYADGGAYGTHVDGAVMPLPHSPLLLRSDLSATLFLAAPDEYDGGELQIDGEFGAQSIKLAAGDLLVYPSSSLHRVTPVTRGRRVAAFFWIQSMVADASERALLFDFDRTIQQLTAHHAADDLRLLTLTGIYHNLLRRWAVI